MAAVAADAPLAEGIDAELDAASVAWLPDGTALLSLKTGQMLVVALHSDGGLVRKIQARFWPLSRPHRSRGACLEHV